MSTVSSSPRLSARARAILTTHHDPTATHDAFVMMQRMYGDRLPDVKALPERLWHDVQQEEYAATDAFCDALQALDNELARMCVVTQSAEDEARQALSCTEQAFHRACDLLDHAHALQDQIRAAQMHQRLAERLLTRFTLTSDEMAIVQAPDAPVDDAFLGVMDRLQTILDESLLLMDVRDEDGETPAGSVQPSARAAEDIRERASSLLQTCMQRLAHWCSTVLRSLPLEGADVTAALREALRRLATREDLFHPTMTALAETRAARWPEAFHMALVVGGPPPSYLPRPIELHAHDAVRYVSDMLAWVHQAIASERELVTSLFAPLAAPATTPLVASARSVEPPVLDALIHRMLDRSLAGCGRLLRMRVQQTLRAEQQALCLLRLYFVLSFYRDTLRHTLNETSSPLCKTVDELYHMADVAFVHALQQLHTRLVVPEQPGRDVPPALVEARERLDDLLKECADDKQDASIIYARIAQHLVGPMHGMCMKTADKIRQHREASSWFSLFARPEKADDPEWDADVFLVHALAPLADTLRKYSALESRHDAVRRDCVAAADRLSHRHYVALHKASGLAEAENAPPSTWSTSFRPAWHAFCAAPHLLFPPERLACIQDASLRNAMHRAALLRLVHTYTRLRAQHASTDLPTAHEVAMVMDVNEAVDATPISLIEAVIS